MTPVPCAVQHILYSSCCVRVCVCCVRPHVSILLLSWIISRIICKVHQNQNQNIVNKLTKAKRTKCVCVCSSQVKGPPPSLVFNRLFADIKEEPGHPTLVHPRYYTYSCKSSGCNKACLQDSFRSVSLVSNNSNSVVWEPKTPAPLLKRVILLELISLLFCCPWKHKKGDSLQDCLCG